MKQATKKKWWIVAGILIVLLMCFTVLFIITRGHPAQITLELGEKVKYQVNTVSGLTMTVYADTVNPTGATVQITNETDNDYLVAGAETSCGINVERGGEWYGIEANRYPHTAEWVGWLLESGTTVEQTLSWEMDYDSLPKGHYRIVRSMGTGEPPWSESDIVRLSAEFDVK